MDSEKKKDALTELVDIAGSETNQPSNNGTVATPTGEKVQLDFNLYIREVAKKIVGVFKRRKAQEQEVLKQIVKKNQEHYERKKTN